MKVTLTNTGATSVLVSGTDGDGWADSLEPNIGYEVNRPEASVIIIGDKPDVREQLKEGFEVLSKMAKKLLDKLAAQPKATPQTQTAAVDTITVDIRNNDDKNAVRVILGDGVSDITIQHGAIQNCSAIGYLELRELGNASQQGGTPD